MNFLKAESSVKPEPFYRGKKTVYLRKNIVKVVEGEGENKTTKWTYDETTMTPQEFDNYSAELILKEQFQGNQSQDVTITALVDLYEKLSLLSAKVDSIATE